MGNHVKCFSSAMKKMLFMVKKFYFMVKKIFKNFFCVKGKFIPCALHD